MHGMMSPDPGGKDARTLTEAWPGLAPVRPARRVTAAALPPLSHPVLATLFGLADCLAVLAPAALLQAMLMPEGSLLPPGAVLLVLSLTVGLTALGGGYGHCSMFGNRRGLLAPLGALGAALGLMLLASLALRAGHVLPPGLLLLWLALGLPLLLAGRLGGSQLVRAAGPATRLRTVILGDGPHAARLTAALRARAENRLRLLGVVDDRDVPRGDVQGGSGLPHLGGMEVLLGMIRRGEVDRVVLALPWAAETRIESLCRRLTDHPVEVLLAPDLVAYNRPGPGSAWSEEFGMLCLARRPMDGWAGLLKRAEDLLLACGALAVAAVPMALIALAIRLDSPGPIFFRQRRTGFNDRPFHVLKFRTMYHHAADHEVRQQVQEGDPRVTPVGAILRRTSLDELPQLLNVLRGEMSFVGPRPHAPGTRAGGRPFEEVAVRYSARHRVKPGLTGLAQVRGLRGPTDTEEKLIRRVESDLEYIENWSLWLDIKIILRTLLAVAKMRNAC